MVDSYSCFEMSFVCMQLQAPFSYLENLAGPAAW